MIGSTDEGRAPPARSLKRLAIFIALLSLTVLVLGFLGRWLWPFDLLTSFRVHCIAALILAAIVLLGVRDWKNGVVAALAAALAAIPLFDYLAPARQGSLPVEGEPSLRALSLNIWFRNEDATRLVDYLAKSGADIVVLQEIAQSQGTLLHSKLEMYPYAYVEGAGESDTVLFSRWPITAAETVRLSSNGVSAIRATIDWNARPITLVAAHLHWPIGPRTSDRRNTELAGLAVLAQSDRGPLLMLGDFNITPWSPHFRAFLDASGLHDCTLGHGLDPTWPSQVIALGIRIDHCFASPHWRSLDARVGPAVGSDHRPMLVELQLTNGLREEDLSQSTPRSRR